MLATYALASGQFGDYVLKPVRAHISTAAVGTDLFVAQADFLTIPADTTCPAFSGRERISKQFAPYSALSTDPLLVVHVRKSDDIGEMLRKLCAATSTRRLFSSTNEAT
jgi:hypothetical protein